MGEGLDDAVAAEVYLAEVIFVEVEREPGQSGGLGAAQEADASGHGFGGDAAGVEADAARLVFLDECHAEPVMGGAQSGDIAAGAGADDCQVVGFAHGRTVATSRANGNPKALPGN